MGDHFLVYCSKAWMLRQLIFALFNVQGAMYPLVMGAGKWEWLLSWNDKIKGLENCSFLRVWLFQGKLKGTFEDGKV